MQSKEKIASIRTEEGTKDGKKIPVQKGAEGGVEISCVWEEFLKRLNQLRTIRNWKT